MRSAYSPIFIGGVKKQLENQQIERGRRANTCGTLIICTIKIARPGQNGGGKPFRFAGRRFSAQRWTSRPCRVLLPLRWWKS
jgi:hypothetical protein